jgi:GntR family transcriptional regulator
MAHSLFHSQLPLWYQVAQSLRAEIHASNHSEPLRIPTEIELATKYGVSVITIRQSLKSLQEDGLIYRQRRHGTFARPNPPAGQSRQSLDLADSVATQSAAEPSDVISKLEISPPNAIAGHFEGIVNVVEFRRRRLVGTDVTAYLINYILPTVGKDITIEAARGSITKAIQGLKRIEIGSFHNTVSAVLPSPQIAQTLQIDLVSPVLFFESICRTKDKTVLEVAQIFYRADKYKFSVEFEIPA